MDLIKLKIPTVTATLSFNVLLHITILFTILSVFFTKYISKVSSDIINTEIKHIVNDGIDNAVNKINKTKDELLEYVKLQNNLIEQFENTDDDNLKTTIKNKIKQTYDIINGLKDKVQHEITNNIFPYEYYRNLFSKEDMTRKSINNEVFFYIKFTNILLIVFLVLFALYLLKTNSINIQQIKEICLENVLVFILVGIVEFLFFTNVAVKYIPIPPSTIYKSFIGSLSK